MEENMNNRETMNDSFTPSENGGMGMSIASMVLGIVSIVCCGAIGIICGIVGIVLSTLALKGNKPGHGMAVAGLTCSIIGVLGGIVYLIFYATSILPFLMF